MLFVLIWRPLTYQGTSRITGESLIELVIWHSRSVSLGNLPSEIRIVVGLRHFIPGKPHCQSPPDCFLMPCCPPGAHKVSVQSFIPVCPGAVAGLFSIHFAGPFFPLLFISSLSWLVLQLSTTCYKAEDHSLCKLPVFHNRLGDRACCHSSPVRPSQTSGSEYNGPGKDQRAKAMPALLVKKAFAQTWKQYADVKLSLIIYSFLPIY